MSLYSPTSDTDQLSHDFSQVPTPRSTFMTSDLRSTPSTSATCLKSANLHHTPLKSTSVSSSSSFPPPYRMYELPERIYVGPGIILEDDRYLFTAQYPDVLHCLDYARSHWKLPVSVSPEILALMALEMFLKPFDPVHWLFWSNERREESTKLVERFTLCRYPTIYHPLVWSTPECTFRLVGLHGKQLAEVLRDKPWYDKLVHSSFKKDSSSKGPNLRKRRPPAQSAPNSTAMPDEVDEELETRPVLKRPRTSRTQTRRKVLSETSSLDVSLPSLKDASPDTLLDFSATTRGLPSNSSPETSLLFEPSFPDFPQEHPELAESDEVDVTTTRRSSGRLSRKTPKVLAAALGRSFASRVPPSPPTSTTASLLSTPDTVTTVLPDDTLVFSHTRSSSRLSAETLVADECVQQLSSFKLQSQPIEISEIRSASTEASSGKAGQAVRSRRVTRQTVVMAEIKVKAASGPQRDRKRKRTGK